MPPLHLPRSPHTIAIQRVTAASRPGENPSRVASLVFAHDLDSCAASEIRCVELNFGNGSRDRAVGNAGPPRGHNTTRTKYGQRPLNRAWSVGQLKDVVVT